MNTITKMIEAYEPESFMCLNVSVDTLKEKFGLSFSEAFVLHVLLREYKGNAQSFGVRSTRHHIAKIRKKLSNFSTIVQPSSNIISLGMGFYMISDPVKELIKNYMEK